MEMLLSYTYDGTGNVLTENSQTYSYDWLNRLTNSSGPWGTVSYAYDSVGNRAQMVNGSTPTDYAYGPFNRLLSAGNVNYTYDANGNLVTKSGGWAYSYDYENRLVNVKHNGVMVQSNSYDGDGNRVIQTVGTNSIVYSYQGVNILYQKNLTSGVATKFFYAGALAVAQMVGSGICYLHDDALRSVRMTTTPSATIAFSSDYTPYGGSYAMVGVEALMYTGKLLDPTTGLYYEGARYYDPRTGRFVTEDSMAGIKTDPLTMNRYLYAADNPMRYVDPTGHMLMVAIGGGYVMSTSTPLTGPTADSGTTTISTNTCKSAPDVCVGEGGTTTVQQPAGIQDKAPSTKMSWDTYMRQFLLNHAATLALDIIQGVVLAADPYLVVLYKQLVSAGTAYVLTWLKDPGNLNSLVGAIQSRNVQSIVGSLAGFSGGILDTFVNGLSLLQRVEFVSQGAAWGFTDAFTGTLSEEVSLGVGGVVFGWDAGQLVGQAWSGWDSCVASEACQ